MQTHVCDQFGSLPWKESVEEYNFSHFRVKQIIDDVRHTVGTHGAQPGEPAPDFELPLVGGGDVRLHDLRGKPLVMRFASYT
jgi:hypothetical protein